MPDFSCRLAVLGRASKKRGGGSNEKDSTFIVKSQLCGDEGFPQQSQKDFFFAMRGFSPQSESTATTTTSSASKVAALHKSQDTVAVSRRDACWLLF